MQIPGARPLSHKQPGPRPAQHSTLRPKPRQAAALQHSRTVSAQSVTAEEASAPAEELGGSISEHERAQYERWAAEVAVRASLPFHAENVLLLRICLRAVAFWDTYHHYRHA